MKIHFYTDNKKEEAKWKRRFFVTLIWTTMFAIGYALQLAIITYG